MRILLIIFVFFIHGEVFAKEFKWKFKERINHDNYYESIGTGVKKVKIDGKNKRIKFKITEYYPLSTELNEKEGRCKDFRIQEISTEDIILEKSYSLNDCLPCIDKGSGHMCSYPYFQVFYRYSDYGIFDEDYKLLKKKENLTDDGAKLVYILVNIGSRERVMFTDMLSDYGTGNDTLDLGKVRYFSINISKFNTRLRKIKSEGSKIKKTQSPVFELVFDRIKNNVLKNIENKTKINIREKDIKILFSAEPSLSITKYQTRD
jgi:hypothetical protein